MQLHQPDISSVIFVSHPSSLTTVPYAEVAPEVCVKDTHFAALDLGIAGMLHPREVVSTKMALQLSIWPASEGFLYFGGCLQKDNTFLNTGCLQAGSFNPFLHQPGYL